MAYKGNGEFELKESDKVINKKVKRLGMIAGGTGVAPMFQIINKVIANRSDKTGISIIYATKYLVYIIS